MKHNDIKDNKTPAVVQTYEQANELRRELGQYLIEHYSAPVIPLHRYDARDNKGKVPIIKEWQHRIETTLEELNRWLDKDEYSNLGLVLGSNSGIIAIDVDGAEGAKILQEISGGDLPETVTNMTPSGGMRYYYRIKYENKDKKFSKYTKAEAGEHTECALLGDGQQTVLPYSIHPNGGIYEFVEGKSFYDIEIAVMPEWMEKLMLRNAGAAKQPKHNAEAAKQSAKHNAEAAIQSGEFEKVCSKCRRLTELLIEQGTNGLCEEDWFLVMRLLINNGYVALAREFSKLSAKHDARSDKRIDELAMEGNRSSLRCMTLGCNENDVLKCHGKLNKNSAGEITNSPHKFIRNDRIQNEKIGFVYDDRGSLAGLNGNVYARHILKNFDFVTKEGAAFYLYTNNCWQEVKEHKLRKMLRTFFNKHEKDKWNSGYESIYMTNLSLETKYADGMTKGLNYINLINGLFNLEKMKLVPHN